MKIVKILPFTFLLMSNLKLITRSPKETKLFAQNLAQKIASRQFLGKTAVILTLSGNLGSGKTVFAQGFCRFFKVKQKIVSPTFVLMKSFRLRSPKIKFQRIYHLDCYRLQKPKEILALGFKKIISEPQNIVLIEWPKKIKKFLPRKTIKIRFQHGLKENERIIMY